MVMLLGNTVNILGCVCIGVVDDIKHLALNMSTPWWPHITD